MEGYRNHQTVKSYFRERSSPTGWKNKVFPAFADDPLEKYTILYKLKIMGKAKLEPKDAQ